MGCFDAIAEHYAYAYAAESLGGYVLRVRKARLLELLTRTSDAAVLDVGCGPGAMGSDFLAFGYRYVGVDASLKMVTLGRARFGAAAGITFGVASALALPFADESFDVVVCTGVLDRLPTPEQAIAEMARVLRPRGVILVSFPNLLSPYASWRAFVFYPTVARWKYVVSRRADGPRPEDRYLRSVPRLWTPKAAAAVVERVVGEVDGMAFYSFQPLLSPLDEWWPRMALRLGRRLERLRCGGLRKLGAGFIIRARKPA